MRFGEVLILYLLFKQLKGVAFISPLQNRTKLPHLSRMSHNNGVIKLSSKFYRLKPIFIEKLTMYLVNMVFYNND